MPVKLGTEERDPTVWNKNRWLESTEGLFDPFLQLTKEMPEYD